VLPASSSTESAVVELCDLSTIGLAVVMRTTAIRTTLLLLHLPSSLAFRVVNERRGALKFISPSSSSSTTTCALFGRQKKDDDEDDGFDSRPNLDIFGQSEEQKKRKKIIDDEGEIRGPDRIKSCIPYLLPLIDGDVFGKYMYERIPPLGTLDYILIRPLVQCVEAVPFLSILIFTAFALGPRFTNQSRGVRFNAQQAILIDVALIIPSLVAESVRSADAHLPRALVEPSSNFVWYVYVSMVVYSIVCNLNGRKPDQIPFISNTAENAIGPF